MEDWPLYVEGHEDVIGTPIEVGDIVRCKKPGLAENLGRVECISFNGASAACIHVGLLGGINVDTTAAGVEGLCPY